MGNYPVHRAEFSLSSGDVLVIEVKDVTGFTIVPVHPSKRRDRLALYDGRGHVIRAARLGDWLRTSQLGNPPVEGEDRTV